MLLSGVVVAALLWVVATRLGYVSDRHLLLVILLGIFWAAAALAELPRRLAGLAGRRSKLAGSPIWGGLLLLGIIAAVLPRTLEPLHANRKGFRHAGLWLGERVRPWDSVLDPYCWSHYYAGKVFHEGTNATPPEGVTPVDYVVVEIAGNEHARLPLMKEAGERSRRGEVVFRWTGRRRKEVVEVVVFAVPRVVSGR
jgi:hypothetical protein